MASPRTLIKIIFAATLTAVLALTMAHPIYSWFEPATLFYEVNGVDVSHHQGKIDWPALAQDNVSFAFIKATEGDNFVDPRFQENWKNAASSGIARGAYHFFTRCSSPEAQAENFMRNVPQSSSALPHIIDAEHMGPCRNKKPLNDLAKAISVILDRLEAHYEQRPLIYTTREFHDTHLIGSLQNETFWIRSLFLPPHFRKNSWLFWQHHNHAYRKGVDHPIDLNVFRGTREDLDSLGKKREE